MRVFSLPIPTRLRSLPLATKDPPMKIRMTEDWKNRKAGDIFDAKDATAQMLIEAGKAEDANAPLPSPDQDDNASLPSLVLTGEVPGVRAEQSPSIDDTTNHTPVDLQAIDAASEGEAGGSETPAEAPVSSVVSQHSDGGPEQPLPIRKQRINRVG